MDFLIEWVTNIILFILLATVIDMLLPNSAMQKYTKIVTGLLLIAIILGPVLKLISSDFNKAMASIPAFESSETNKNSKTLIEIKKKEIQASQQAYILEQMAVQLKEDAQEELMKRFGLQIATISIDAELEDGQNLPDQVRKVAVLLKWPDKNSNPIQPVEVVNIQAVAARPAQSRSELEKLAAECLAEKWNIRLKAIEVTVEGR
ncbi:stage III sporulation protein AF [Neobacillus notoginsengisoli]|uniref:Stage III sporulation protein AF n=1 Tax=Neobacillus notoginsengisoli TaxID=1578198 RepID=A0A417YUZ1_9BACI|nr:stage III sporulation protein AF [Neobacillus notoginsengisoli]RHW41114.1 stage III sporulation protein AF [Neobacillus notoginsengisoli]